LDVVHSVDLRISAASSTILNDGDAIPLIGLAVWKQGIRAIGVDCQGLDHCARDVHVAVGTDFVVVIACGGNNEHTLIEQDLRRCGQHCSSVDQEFGIDLAFKIDPAEGSVEDVDLAWRVRILDERPECVECRGREI